MALSVGQLTSWEADRSGDRSPPSAFAHAFASQRFDRVPTPPIWPPTPQFWSLVSGWLQPEPSVAAAPPEVAGGPSANAQPVGAFCN